MQSLRRIQEQQKMCEVAWCDGTKQLIRRQGPFTQESSQRHLSKQADIEGGSQQKKVTMARMQIRTKV